MRGRKNNGFTLLEMALVMVILSVVAGGITLGADLIHAAKLRATLRQVDEINISYNSFRLKYGCLPGDCEDPAALGFPASATIKIAQNNMGQIPSLLARFKPIAEAHAFTLVPMLYVTANISKGNFDGRIDNPIEVLYGMTMLHKAFPLPNYSSENQRLELPIDAGSELFHSNNYATTLNINGFEAMLPDAVIPVSSFSKAFWYVTYFSREDGHDTLIEASGNTSGHYLFPASSAYNTLGGSALSTTPINVYWIDSKIDDGNPLSGKVAASSDNRYRYESGPSYIAQQHAGPAGQPFCINEETKLYNLLPRVYAIVCSFFIKGTF